jgi:hypothetical protein
VIATSKASAVLEAAPRTRARYAWIYGARADLLISLCWIPLFLAAHVLTARHGASNDHLLNMMVNGAFLTSLLHQPLTLALVYGDRTQFALRRRLFTWSPLIGIALVATAVFANLWIIVPIAALWNTIHTLQQRYGLSRIYGRKAGFGSARLDRGVLYAWMAVALLIVGSAPATLHGLSRVMLDDRNAMAITTLTRVRPYAVGFLVPGLLIAVIVTAALIRQEARHLADANRAKWIYQVSSVLVILVIAYDPIAGFIAYVGGHAIEYFVIVFKTMEKRYEAADRGSSFLGRVARARGPRVAFLLVFLGVFLFIMNGLASWFSNDTYLIAFYSVGMLHFWYDSFIWKLRKPAVAANFGIAPR